MYLPRIEQTHKRTKSEWNNVSLMKDVCALIETANIHMPGLQEAFDRDNTFELHIPSFPFGTLVIGKRTVQGATWEKQSIQSIISLEMTIQNVKTKITFGDNDFPVEIILNNECHPVIEYDRLYPSNKRIVHEKARLIRPFLRKTYLDSAKLGRGFTGLSVQKLKQ